MALNVQMGRGEETNPLRSVEAFAAFYERQSEALLRFFTRRVYDPQLALDLTAETFAQAFLSRRRFHGSAESQAAAWIHVIARRQLARFHRRGRAERRALDRLGLEVPELSHDDWALVEELADLEGVRSAFQSGLAQLSADHRDALQMRVVEERAYPEMAARLGISEQTARARVSRALRALGRTIENEPRIEEAAQ